MSASARTAEQQVAEILENHGEPLAGNTWRVQGTLVIYHKALERIAASASIAYDPPQVIRSERDEAVILVTGRMGDRVEWSIGEALVGVNYRISGRQAAYVYAMAEKRAKDRVILKLVGLHGLLYSEEEADEFRDAAPSRVQVHESDAQDNRRQQAHQPQRGRGRRQEAAPAAKGDEPPFVTELRGKIDQAKTINAVTDLMLDPETQKGLATTPDAWRDEIRDHAKGRLVALGWPAKRRAAPATDQPDEPDADVLELAAGVETDIEKCETHEAVTELMQKPGTQEVLAALPVQQMEALRELAKSRMVTLGWSRTNASQAGKP